MFIDHFGHKRKTHYLRLAENVICLGRDVVDKY